MKKSTWLWAIVAGIGVWLLASRKAAGGGDGGSPKFKAGDDIVDIMTGMTQRYHVQAVRSDIRYYELTWTYQGQLQSTTAKWADVDPYFRLA